MMTERDMQARYGIRTEWAGNTGEAAGAPGAITPDHWIGSETLAPIPGTTDRGDNASPYRYCPEQLLVASLSTGQMLAYLALAAEAGLTITSYLDRARAEIAYSKGRTIIQRILLMPHIMVGPDVDMEVADALIDEAHARSSTGIAANIDIVCEASFERDGRLLEVA